MPPQSVPSRLTTAQSLIAIVGVTALLVAAATPRAAAQSASPSSGRIGAHRYPRIEVNPRPLLHRRCVDWYELQYRPSGTVLYPQYHCWWVRG